MQRRQAYQGWSFAIVVLGISLWSVCNAVAQEGCEKSLFIENDSLFPSDRYYTAGFVWARFCYADRKVALSVSHLFEENKFLGESFYGGLTLYTPNDLGSNEPTKEDGRPYSSPVFVGSNVFLSYGPKTVNGPKTVIKHDLHFAVLGLDWGGKLQRWWHDVIGSQEPKGWPSQISDGGELSFMYAVEGRKLFFPNKENKHFSLSGNFGASIGYYNTVKGSLSVMVGNVLPPFWSDYGPASRVSGAIKLHSHNGPYGKRTLLKYYAFLMGGADFVIYKALLQGQFRDIRDNGFKISNSDISRMVPSGSAGFVLGFRFSSGRGIHFSFSYSWKGEEIKGGEDHLWNSLSVGCSY